MGGAKKKVSRTGGQPSDGVLTLKKKRTGGVLRTHFKRGWGPARSKASSRKKNFNGDTRGPGKTEGTAKSCLSDRKGKREC